MRRRLAPDGWTLIAAAIGLLVAIPVGSVLLTALGPSDGIWSHLASTVLPVYVGNTLWLMVGVAVGTIVIGTSTAWLVTMYRFPGRRILSWALLLPLAVPSYILAFVITDQLEYAGNVQSALRDMFGWTSARDYWFPEIRSLGGAIIVLSLVLYPYVYLLARAAFIEQSLGLFETSRTLGRGPVASFFSIAVPLARPAIAVGVALALMETLNEFGTIDFFAVPTLTAGIFDVWLNMDSTAGAAQLASVLVAFTLVLVVIERISRRSRRYHDTTTRVQALPEYPLSRGRAAAALVWCAAPVALGFVLPACVLGDYALVFYAVTLEADYFDYVWNSMMLAVWAAAITAIRRHRSRLRSPTLAAACDARACRVRDHRLCGAGSGARGRNHGTARVLRQRARRGEPQVVRSAARAAHQRHRDRDSSSGMWCDFSRLDYRTVDSGLSRVTPSIEGAARTLGANPTRALVRVHVPLIRPSVVTAALLVFVDTMKELPLTLILRPFNFDTLATFVYQYASDELLEECALGALTIVAAGVVPVMVMSRTIARSRPGHGNVPLAA